jgi:hypothetical protein
MIRLPLLLRWRRNSTLGPSGGAILLEDGIDFLMQEDGLSFILLE